MRANIFLSQSSTAVVWGGWDGVGGIDGIDSGTSGADGFNAGLLTRLP
jgi:hypothetical protein